MRSLLCIHGLVDLVKPSSAAFEESVDLARAHIPGHFLRYSPASFSTIEGLFEACSGHRCRLKMLCLAANEIPDC